MLRASNRREFLGDVGRAAGAGAVAAALGAVGSRRLEAAVARVAPRPAAAVADDEDFWRTVQDEWDVDRSLVNLNNGGCSPAPRLALEKLFRDWRYANGTMYHNLMRVLDPQVETVRAQLAKIFGASPDEVAIVRNASEALEDVTFGLELKPGDEVLSTALDYPRMVTAWKQRAARDGVVFRQIPIPVPPKDLGEIVTLFAQAITPRTRVLHFCHVVFLTGQILPVQALCRLARSKGILTICDGAHAFAHVDAKLADLECDFYGTSLHKWFSAPVGNGMLYVRKELIPTVWPLMAHDDPKSGDVRKFEQFGTHPVPVFLSIAEAARLHESIGGARKQERMRLLRDRWARPLSQLPNVKLLTSLERAQSCGIATMAIDGIDAGKLAEHLFQRHQIVVSPMGHPDVKGIRVTPHVYTTLPELDRFVEVVAAIAKNGIPS
jgi:selenocysteine lyase/cysteine desulfurase